jgi:hypothetical protein
MFSLPPRRCATACAKSTVPEGSPKTDARAGALGFARGAPEPATIDAELAPSHLALASCRRHPLPSQGERVEIPVSPRCYR